MLYLPTDHFHVKHPVCAIQKHLRFHSGGLLPPHTHNKQTQTPFNIFHVFVFVNSVQPNQRYTYTSIYASLKRHHITHSSHQAAIQFQIMNCKQVSRIFKLKQNNFPNSRAIIFERQVLNIINSIRCIQSFMVENILQIHIHFCIFITLSKLLQLQYVFEYIYGER